MGIMELLAKTVSQHTGITINKSWEETQEADGGFSWGEPCNEYNVQVAPYNGDGRYILSLYDGKYMRNIATCSSIPALCSAIKENMAQEGVK